MKTDRLRGNFYIIAAAIFFGIMPIWVKLAYATGLSALGITFLRSGMAAVMLGVFISYKGIPFHVEKEQFVPLLVSTVLGYTGTIVTLYSSYNYVSSGVATSLHYLYPVLVMAIACFVYHEKLMLQKWIALIISLFGIYLISKPGGSSFSFTGVALASSSAIFFAIYTLSINLPELKRLDSLVLAFYNCFTAAVTALILLLVKGNWPVITLKGFYYTSLVSFFCTVLALIFFIKGVKLIGSANASILCTLEPVVSLIAGIVILYEPLTLFTSIGCILIVAAVFLIGYSDLHKGSIS